MDGSWVVLWSISAPGAMVEKEAELSVEGRDRGCVGKGTAVTILAKGV